MEMDIAHEQAQEEFLRTMPHLLKAYYRKLNLEFTDQQAFVLVRDYQNCVLGGAVMANVVDQNKRSFDDDFK